MIYVFDYATLKVIWWVVVGLLLVGFAILDGFDLGVGMLLPFVGRTDDERRVVLNAVGPTWEGNQVWFITAGGATFAAWPLVYATAFSGFYIALILDAVRALPPAGRASTIAARCRIRAGAAPGTGASSSAASCPRWCSASRSATCCWACRSISTATSASFYTGSFFGLLNPFALLAGVVSVAMLDDARRPLSADAHRGRGAGARDPCGAHRRHRVRRAFAAAGFWIATASTASGSSSMPPADTRVRARREDGRAAAGRLARTTTRSTRGRSPAPVAAFGGDGCWRSSPRPGDAPGSRSSFPASPSPASCSPPDSRCSRSSCRRRATRRAA